MIVAPDVLMHQSLNADSEYRFRQAARQLETEVEWMTRFILKHQLRVRFHAIPKGMGDCRSGRLLVQSSDDGTGDDGISLAIVSMNSTDALPSRGESPGDDIRLTMGSCSPSR
ncbi:hypothetical protein PG997_006776 [Apiospora hydei]|uniref:Uncharacterized protein n=1 Tax=Apiospora hydei TaxID=1337664 RepID=A0ABR1WRT9_9PEZI